MHYIDLALLLLAGFVYRVRFTYPLGGGWLSGSWTPGVWPSVIGVALAAWGLLPLISAASFLPIILGSVLLVATGILWPRKKYVWIVQGFKGGYFHYGKLLGAVAAVTGAYLLTHVAGF